MRCLVIFSIVFMIGTSVFGQESGKMNSGDVPKNKSHHVTFSIRRGSGGCANCESSVAEMLKDAKMMGELEKLFPENSSVVFYVRKHKNDTVVPEKEIAIAVGNCAGGLKPKAKVFISGCGRRINKAMIYKMLVAELTNKNTNK